MIEALLRLRAYPAALIGGLFYLLLLLPLYMYQDDKLGSLRALPYKLLLASAFCLLGCGSLYAQPSIFASLIVAGLLSSWGGDYYLAFAQVDEAKFGKGIGFFALAQLFYIVAQSWRAGLGWVEFGWAALIFALPLSFCLRHKARLGRVALPLLFYSALLIFMAVKSVTVVWAGDNSPQALVLALGAVLFLLSDFCLGLQLFVAPKRLFGLLVAAFYFSAQLLLGAAILLP